MKELYVVGAGGFGREVAWLVERINQNEKEWELKGFLDDNEQLHGGKEDGYPVVGGIDYLEKLSKTTWVICAVGAASVRRKIIEKLEKIEKVSAGTIATVDIEIGKHVIVNLDCTIGHDAKLEDYVTVYPSVNISGFVTVGEETEIGTGTQIIQGIKIGRESIIGAGAVVIKELPEKCTAVGSPAKVIKFRE